MAQAIKDNIPDGAKIALINTMACLDREQEIVRFTECKEAFKQTFVSIPPNDTFYGQNTSKDYNSKEYPRERRSRPDSRSRDRPASRSRNPNNRSGFTTVSFHVTGPGT